MNIFTVFAIGLFCFALGMVAQHKLCIKKMKDFNTSKKLEES